MNCLKKTTILALAMLMALSTTAVASASTPSQAEDTQGIFGTFVKRDGNSLTVMTKEGEITVAVTGESEFKAPGTGEDFTLDNLTTGDKLAIQVAQREGTRVAVRIMRMPGQPTYIHRVEVVVSAEGSTLTVTDRDGSTRVIEVPQDVAQNIVGQVVTTINRELRDTDKEATREAKGLVRAEKTKEKLEDHLEKVGTQQAEGDANVQQKGREVERRVAQLQRLQQQAISILEELAEKAPEQAKEALNRALELAKQSREISAELIQRVEHASKVELGKVKGVIEAINVDAGTIEVAFENGNVVTVRIADDGKIVRNDEEVFLEDLGVGDVIVRAAYNPESFTAYALVIRAPEKEEREKPDDDSVIRLRETLKGYIKVLDLTSNAIQVSSSDTGPEVTVTITADTKIEKNGEVVGIDQLAIRDFILVVLDPQSSNVLQLIVRSPEDVEKPREVDRHRKVAKGHVVGVNLEERSITIAETGEEVTDTIVEAGKEATGITVRITEKTRIVRNGKDGTLLREFAAGDTLLHLVYDVQTMEAVMIVVDARKVNRPTVEILKLHGVIKSLEPNTGAVILATNRGIVEVTVSPDTKITENGQAVTLADLEPRDVVEAAMDAETKTLLSLEVTATVSITPLKPSPSATNATGGFDLKLKGVIRGLDLDSRTLVLVTREGSRKFHVAEDAEIKKNGEAIRFQDLELGNIVEVKVDPASETIVQINVTSAQVLQQEKPEVRDMPTTLELKGIIKSVELHSNTLVIATPEGRGKFTLTDETEIHKNGAEASLKDLYPGDELWVRLDKESRTILEMEVYTTGPVTALEPVQTGSTSRSSGSDDGSAAAVAVVKGVIGGLDLQANTIILVTEKGEVQLHVTRETTIYKDGERASLAQLEVQDRVWATVQVEGRIILKMEVRSPDDSTTDVPSTGSTATTTTTTVVGDRNTDANSVIEVNGTIQAIYPDANTLVLITDGGTVKLLVTRETTIYKDGAESTFSHLQPRDLAWATVSGELHTALKIEAHSPKPATTNDATSGVPSIPSGEAK